MNLSTNKHRSSGNPSHVHQGIGFEHMPDRGRRLNVRGWSISQVTYEILVAVLGPARAEQHCEALAKRQEA